MNLLQVIGSVFVLCGGIYVVHPDILRRGHLLRTSLAIRKFSPGGYVKYMRGLGIVFMAIGIVLFVYGLRNA